MDSCERAYDVAGASTDGPSTSETSTGLGPSEQASSCVRMSSLMLLGVLVLAYREHAMPSRPTRNILKFHAMGLASGEARSRNHWKTEWVCEPLTLAFSSSEKPTLYLARTHVCEGQR